jgi:aminomethyltransferase
VQGPACDAVLSPLWVPVGHSYMSFVDADFNDIPITVCRTGYTGERGYELLVPWDDAHVVWDALLASGEPQGIIPCGLGARDTLRTEMGYPLHGQDISPETSPVAARLGWAVKVGTGFVGERAYAAAKEAGPSRRMWGMRATGRGIPRAGCEVLRDGDLIGETTSGTFSPTLRVGIALGYLDTSVEAGDRVEIRVRGKSVPAEVQRPPRRPLPDLQRPSRETVRARGSLRLPGPSARRLTSNCCVLSWLNFSQNCAIH